METNHPVDGARITGGSRPGDFFTRLAERTLGIALLAQPVIAPAFAREQGLSASAGIGFFEWAAAARDLEETTSADAASILSPAGESLRPVSGVDPSPLAPAVRIQPEGMPARPVSSESLVSPAPSSLPATAPADVPGLGDGLQEDRAHSVFPRSSAVEQAASDPTRQLAHRLVPTARSAEQPEEQGDSFDGPPPILLSDQTDSQGLAVQLTAALGAARRDTPLAALPARTVPEASHQPPTIRITIGRVEVRAVQAPPTPSARPASRPAPALSLADYLKGRNEAGR